MAPPSPHLQPQHPGSGPFSPPMAPQGQPMLPFSGNMQPPSMGFVPGSDAHVGASQTCSYWGQPSACAQYPDLASFGCGNGPAFEPRPLMTIEELPLEACAALQDEGKLAIIDGSSAFFPAPVSTGLCKQTAVT